MAVHGSTNDVSDDARRSETTAQRVERELRRAIITLEFKPGRRLSEADIAAHFGVSRQPAREAIIGLARTGLVETQPQRGTVVVKISARKMMEARFVRESVEAAVARRVADHIDPHSLARCHALIAAQVQAAAREDHSGFQRLDEMFHVTLAEGAGCGMAWEVIAGLKAHMDRVCQLTLPLPSALDPIIAQHRAILAAIEARDPAEAEAAMRHHLAEILRTLPQVEADHPDLFEA